MSKDQIPAKAIPFDLFKDILNRMSNEIIALQFEVSERKPSQREGHTYYMLKMIRFQTLIACGGYLGLSGKTLLALKWSQVIRGKYRSLNYSKVKMMGSNFFSTLIDRNYLIASKYWYIGPQDAMIVNNKYYLNPENALILYQPKNSEKAVTNRYFNEQLKLYLDLIGYGSIICTTMALRKTFLQEACKKLGNDLEAFEAVCSTINSRKRSEALEIEFQ